MAVTNRVEATSADDGIPLPTDLGPATTGALHELAVEIEVLRNRLDAPSDAVDRMADTVDAFRGTPVTAPDADPDRLPARAARAVRQPRTRGPWWVAP